jgi:hypothetical protein
MCLRGSDIFTPERGSPERPCSYSSFRMVGDEVALTAANPKLDVKVSLHPAFQCRGWTTILAKMCRKPALRSNCELKKIIKLTFLNVRALMHKIARILVHPLSRSNSPRPDNRRMRPFTTVTHMVVQPTISRCVPVMEASVCGLPPLICPKASVKVVG